VRSCEEFASLGLVFYTNQYSTVLITEVKKTFSSNMSAGVILWMFTAINVRQLGFASEKKFTQNASKCCSQKMPGI